jgi:tetratricopeptide (TPR) repeat protein
MKQVLPFALLALLLAACSTVAPAAPDAALPPATFELDPRAGWSAGGATAPASYERAMRDLAAGRSDRARQRLEDLAKRAPVYPPALLALGVLDLQQGHLAAAASRIEAAAAAQEGWLAAEYYLARLETERGDLDAAAARLRALAARPGAPAPVASRLAAVETQLFDRLFQSANGAEPSSAIVTLRRALAIRPDSRAARLLLVQNLISMRNFAEARMEIDPLLQSSDAAAVEVQAALAEIDAGRGRFEDAIERYERVVRAEARPEYSARLETIKTEFALANMPPRYRAAAASTQLTRADLATLVYWTVSGVRFGRPPAEPAVAVDVADVESREELVRAIAFGLFPVDPITRRVSPDRVVTAATAARVLHRVLALTAAAACLSGADTSTHAGIVAALDACGVDTSALRGHPDVPVSGSWALGALRTIDAMRVR